MPVTLDFIRRLDERCQWFNQRSNENTPRNGTIPVGGGEWMGATGSAVKLA